jgi:tight adherence protein B
MSAFAAPLAVPLALALCAAAAAWLGVVGAARGRTATHERRARRRALITGHGSALAGAAGGRTAASSSTHGRRRLLPGDGTARRALPALSAAGAAALAGGALIGPLAGAAFAAGALALFALAGSHRRSARRARLNHQIPELLQAIAGALVAGQSFLQALDQVTREIGDPLRGELAVVLGEVELGVSLEQALEGLRERTADHDLALVVDAVLIQRRVGGNLAEVLSNIAWTVRERIRIRGEVRALTGQARLSSWVLSALPLALAGVLMLLNHDYMRPLFETGLGRALLACALVAELIGMLIMRRIANVRV